MPRTRRWDDVSGTFSAGVLSPAAQDNVRQDVWRAGAARLENFRIDREGGLSGRPAFIRHDPLGRARIDPPPLQGLLVDAQGNGMTWSVDTGTGGSTNTGQGGMATGTFPSNLYQSPATKTTNLEDVEGVARFRRENGELLLGGLVMTVATVDPTKDLLKINLARPGAAGAITFHGARMARGVSSWEFQNSDSDRRLTFEVIAIKDDDTEVRLAQDVPDAGTDEDPFGIGQFCPGYLPRDIVVRMDKFPRTERVNFKSIAIRVKENVLAQGQMMSLIVEGVSCFDLRRSGGQALEAGVLNAPYRIIPWTIRDVAWVLVLGMRFVATYQIFPGENRAPEWREGGEGSYWSFTARQLRELTWCKFGGNLLLMHTDFPHPLEVALPGTVNNAEGQRINTLLIRPLSIKNVPKLAGTALQRTTPIVGEGGGAISTIAPDLPATPQIPLDLAALPVVEGIRVQWAGVPGATEYEIYYDDRAVYDSEVNT